MRRRSGAAILLLCVIACVAVAGEGGRLDRMRRDARGSGSKPDKPDKPRRGDDDDDDDADLVGSLLGSMFGDAFGDVFKEMLWYTVGSPFSLPRAAMRDQGWEPGLFTDYPYSDGPGYLGLPSGPGTGAPVDGSRPLACSASFAYGHDGAVETFRGEFAARTACRASLRLSYTGLLEDLGGATDTLAFGDVTVLARFAQHARAQMRTGLGAVSMLQEGESGVLFVYEGDFFPRKPLVISAGADLGDVGDAVYTRLHLSAGIALQNVELLAGYSSLRVGSVTVKGATVGLRVWF